MRINNTGGAAKRLTYPNYRANVHKPFAAQTFRIQLAKVSDIRHVWATKIRRKAWETCRKI